MTLSHLDLQWGEPCSEATFGTGARIAGSTVTVANPAASSGQPLVLAILEAVNPDLAPVCQVGKRNMWAGWEWQAYCLSGLGHGTVLSMLMSK